MKKLFLLLLVFPFLFSCSSDDKENEPKQDYTSFVVENKSSSVDLPNVVVGYVVNNEYIKLASLGDIKANGKSKEIKVDDPTIQEIYLFADYFGTIKINKGFLLVSNIVNTFRLTGDIETVQVLDKTNPLQYPQ